MIKDIFRVFTTNMIKFFVALIATFLIPALLSVDEYGYYKVFGLYSAYIGVLHFGFCDGVFLNYGGKSLDKTDKRRTADEQTTLIIFEIIMTLILLTVGIVMKDIIVVLLALDVVPVIMVTLYTYIYQSSGDFKRYARIYNFQSLVTLVVNSLLVFVIKPDSGVLFSAAAVGINYAAFIFAMISFNRNTKAGMGRFDLSLFKSHAVSGFLLTVGNLSFLLFDSIDRWFVKGLLGLTFFSYYSYAGQLLSALNMFANPIGMTLFSYLSRKKSREFERRIKSAVISMLFFMLCGVFPLRLIVRLFYKKYEAALPLMNVLFLAQVFMLLNMIIYVNLYKSYKQQKKYFMSLVTVIAASAAFNALFYFCIKKSMLSIAAATLASMILWTVINSLNFKSLRLGARKLMFMLILSAGFMLTGTLMGELSGMAVYLVLFVVSFRLLMPEIWQMFISKLGSAAKGFGNIFRRK